MNHPDNNDVVIHRKNGNASGDYVVGTLAAPDQFTLRTRDQAIAHAITFARRQQLRAWMVKGEDDYVLLGSFVPVARSARECKTSEVM